MHCWRGFTRASNFTVAVGTWTSYVPTFNKTAPILSTSNGTRFEKILRRRFWLGCTGIAGIDFGWLRRCLGDKL
jgi:hypothetical protein